MTRDSHRPGDLERLRQLETESAAIREQIHKVVVGQDAVVEQLLIAIFANGHCILEGVPGLAKTLLVSTLARCLSSSFARIQFTPDLMPSDITGTEVMEEDRATGKRAFRFLSGPLFHHIVLADEINRTPPKTQAALLEGMQERQVSVAGQRHPLPRPFFVLATQNPIEQEGTYPLPEAQMDRFLFKILVDYPERDVEREVYRMLNREPQDPTPVMGEAEILSAQDVVRRVPVDDTVLEYVLNLVRATRSRHGEATELVRSAVVMGAGPRAGQALLTASKVRAALHGRPAASLDDVRAVAHPVLRHRIVLNYGAEAEGQTPDSLIDRLLETVPTHAVRKELDDQVRQVLQS